MKIVIIFSPFVNDEMAYFMPCKDDLGTILIPKIQENI